MKKSLLALAVLSAITGAASAQSSVTLYGTVDLGLVVDSGSPAGKSVRLDSGVSTGSRLGFKGVEDLGGGTKASFDLETGYCANGPTGANGQPGFNGYCSPNGSGGSFMGRQAWGALSGAFGNVSAGLQYSQGFLALSTIDPFAGGLAGASINLLAPSGIRLSNSFQYTTPTFYGVNAAVEVSLSNETTGNWAGGRETGGALTYAQGPAYAAVTYYGLDNVDGSGMAQEVYQAGGTYDFGVAKVAALYQHVSGSPDAVNPVVITSPSPMLGSVDQDNWLVGATVPLAGGNLMASYISLKDKTSNDLNASQWGLGYTYPLSKRTSLYTAFAKITPTGNSTTTTYTVGNASSIGTGTGNKSFNLGAVHSF